MHELLRKSIKKLLRTCAANRRRHEETLSMPGQLSRVLYFIAGGIGDGILAFPAIRLIRRLYPDAHLLIYVPPSSYDVLRAAFSEYDVRSLTKWNAFRLVFSRADICFTNTIAVFRLSIESLSYIVGRKSFGFRYPEEKSRERLYDHTIPISSSIHDTDQNLQLVADGFGVTYQEDDRLLMKRRWDTISSDGPVVIHPGVAKGFEYKKWPLENFVDLARRLSRSTAQIHILLGPSDTTYASDFRQIPHVSIQQNLDGRRLIEELQSASAFIGNDSGPAHLASFYGVPTITLIGPADPLRTAPRATRTIPVYKKQPCSPCHFSTGGCTHNICMTAIGVDDVLESMDRLRHMHNTRFQRTMTPTQMVPVIEQPKQGGHGRETTET